MKNQLFVVDADERAKCGQFVSSKDEPRFLGFDWGMFGAVGRNCRVLGAGHREERPNRFNGAMRVPFEIPVQLAVRRPVF